jgi:ankyrin repeat protein
LQVVPGPERHCSQKQSPPTATPAAPWAAPDHLLLNAVECNGRQDAVQLVELLLQRGLNQGLNLEQVNQRGETALLAAVRNGNVKVSISGLLMLAVCRLRNPYASCAWCLVANLAAAPAPATVCPGKTQLCVH